MEKNSRIIPLSVGVLSFSLLICAAIYAWTEPSAAPTGGNINAPINTGSTAQTKAGDLNISGNLITSGNVGIGTASPNAKLNVVSGMTNLSRDNTGECCSIGDATLSLAESTSVTGKKAGIQFHDSGVSEGQLRLDAGINGRELKAYSYQTDMDLHATGYVQGDQGVCLGADCRTAWPTGVIAQTCPTGQGMIGVNASGNIICSGSGLTLSFPCNGSLPAGAKKIFITSTLYSGYDATVETTADAKCQAAANNVGFPGTYKALVYMGNRSPLAVLPSGQTFWNGQKTGSTCTWNMVAANPADFFSDDGGGVYLQNPILYNEQGLPMNNIVVWTGFAGNGNGSMQTLGYAEYKCNLGVYATNGRLAACLGRHAFYNTSGYAAPCNDAAEWYGIASNKTRGWSYNVNLYGAAYGDNFATMNQCGAQTRAFYCVEQ